VALTWMLREAAAAGLLISDTADVSLTANPTASTEVLRLHDKLRDKPLWWILEFVPFPHYDYASGKTFWRINHARRRSVQPGSLIHASAYARGADYVALLPAGGIITE
jgi:hypothetical protein